MTRRNLQKWALSAASQFQSDTFVFKASESWVTRFKQKHGLRQRRITSCVSEEESVTLEEMLAAANEFRPQTRAIIPKFDKDFIINTDQTGCQYQSRYDRTLAGKNSKTVSVQRRDLNTITDDSYTAQYAITMSGKLVPLVFLCLQESMGEFSRGVQKTVNKLKSEFTNVVVTSSKSGKLTSELYESFLRSVLLPYVKKEKFLLLVDSGKDQTNPTLYEKIFIDDEGLCTCTVKVIPAKCKQLCQPCDFYFHRQVTNFVKRIQNCSYLIETERDIVSREDAIRIHSIVHHQLSAPIFSDMLRYAWFASKLTNERDIFLNVNEVCFPVEQLKISCSCKNPAFIKCSFCRSNLCFICLYDEYHPAKCTVPSTSND